ncbi:MAG: acyltransferase [Bacteroidia bacterium]|nr:acyltransferase [Bacteroidia bacterium]
MLRGKNVKFISAGRITFGKFLKLGNNVTLSGLGKEGIKLGNNVGIGSHSLVMVSTSLNDIGKGITIGDNVGIGEFAYLGGAGGLDIGRNCIIGQYLSCHPENHNYREIETLIRLQGVNRKGIKIAPNCWIGSKVTILDGVSIGEGSIIAAGAVVTSSFPANSIIGGVPAKLLKTRIG